MPTRHTPTHVANRGAIPAPPGRGFAAVRRVRARLHGFRAVGERGSASIQMVLLLPVLFAVMFLGLQAALFYHARTVAIAAAQEGARAAAGQAGSSSRGTIAAHGFVADAGGDDVLTAVTVTVHRSPTAASVTVTGRSMSVIPGWAPPIAQSATVPVERLTR